MTQNPKEIFFVFLEGYLCDSFTPRFHLQHFYWNSGLSLHFSLRDYRTYRPCLCIRDVSTFVSAYRVFVLQLRIQL